MASTDTQEDALLDEYVIEAQERGIIEIEDDRVIYNIKQKKDYDWTDPEEWVRARRLIPLSQVPVSDAFKGKSRVQQHQMVYQALQGRMGTELHALALQTSAPPEA